MGLLKTAAKVAVASSVHGRVQRRQQQRWAEQDRQTAVPSTAPGPVPAATVGNGQDDLSHQLELIRQLNDLRTAGALTDAEFEEKKRQVLQA